MAEPTIVPGPRTRSPVATIDPDALKVLYRLHEHNYVAYLVGGSVRDLLLDRRPKDFDIGTSAHPHQVKKLFRNCWIIGRRFRLAHVKFGTKTIEVATFRRQVDASSDAGSGARRTLGRPTPSRPTSGRCPIDERAATPTRAAQRDRLIQRDNTYGTPEEDAFRRDFTVNALFYDIGTFSIIDYVGGLDDLDARLIRCIGDPDVRFLEDPVRMLRAVVLAARLEFTIDEPILEAIDAHRARDRAQRAGAAARGVLQDPALRARRGGLPAAARDRAAEGDHAGARDAPDPLWRVDRGARSLPRAVRRRARHADQRDPRRHAAAAARPGRAPPALLRRSARAPRRARPAADRAPRRRAAAADPRPAAAAARHPGAAARAARRCCTARRSTKRSPGSTFTATAPTSSRTGASCRRRRRARIAPLVGRAGRTRSVSSAAARRRRRRERAYVAPQE